MQSLASLLDTLPGWLLPVGWFALLLGWVLGRPATTSFLNKVTVVGFNNSTTNRVTHETSHDANPGGDSPLSKAGSWASLIGLALTLLPVFKDWLK